MFPLLVLTGIYPITTGSIFVQGLKQMEGLDNFSAKNKFGLLVAHPLRK